MQMYDDERKYSIKETSDILGINEKSLRYYDNIGLLTPYYRDPDNQYRYYTIKQFYLLELFKYAKALGLSVNEYRALLITGEQAEQSDYAEIEQTLDGLLEKNRNEVQHAMRCIEDIEYMKSNLDILRNHNVDGDCFIAQMPPRCVYVVDHDPESSFENTSIKMRENRTRYKNHLTERYGVLLDVNEAKHGKISITKQFIILNEYFEETEDVMYFPGGTYASCLYHAYRPKEKMQTLSKIINNVSEELPYLIADELNYYDDVNEIIHAVRIFQGKRA